MKAIKKWWKWHFAEDYKLFRRERLMLLAIEIFILLALVAWIT